MTSRHRRQLFLAPKRPRTDARYGLHVLDNTLEEIRPRIHREATADDPWLSPARSEAVRALLVLIQAAEHVSSRRIRPLVDLDLRSFCEDAKLDPSETEVIVLYGEGWVQRQVAEWLGISQATVSRRLSTGRHKLAGWLPLVVAMKLHAS